MPSLETVDLPGVEILSAGGPVHGVGSPPEGDFWSKTDLEAIAAANRDLAAELQAPNKIGHSEAQALLLNSGVQPTPGEMPAVGWLDGKSFSVVERDGVAKLVADIKDVPKKLADLLEAKAYRTRSVELSRVESQELTDDAGKPRVFDWVVSGLAWLGAKLPAVRTLDDIVALYESEGLDGPAATVFVVYAAGDVVWDPEAGFQDLRDDVAEALNGPPTGGMNSPRFWVADIAVTLDAALVEDYYDDAGSDAWVIPFTRAADDTITIAPSSDWTKVERGWVEAARELQQRALTVAERRADIRPSMAKTYTDEQRRTFAEATGLEVEKVTDELLEKAGVAAVPAPEPAPKPDPDGPKPDERALEQNETFRALQAQANQADERSRKLEEELRVERRDNFVAETIKSGKAQPSQEAEIKALYDAAPDVTRKFWESAPVNNELLLVYGADAGDLTEEERELEERAYEDEASSRLGIPKGALL